MSAQVAITQLPAAGPITGAESVPIVQNGVTVQTTTGAIAASPSQTQTFLTVVQEPTLPNSRYFGATNGLSISDGGAQGLFNISTTGALSSLVASGTGFQVKTSSTAITGRSIAVTGAGLAITDGDGIAGNPTIGLAGQVLALQNLSANGLMTITTGGVINATYIQGTTNQIGVANGTGVSGYPTISLADNPVLPGTGAVQVPSGTSAQQPLGVNGKFRYNIDINRFEGYQNGSWYTFGVGDGTVTSVAGTANQITVVSPTTTPTISLASNPVLPGTGSVTLPQGSTAARPVAPTNGMFRYNTDTALLEAYLNGVWTNLASGSGVTSVATGTGLTGGPITSTGTIAIANTTVTAGSYDAATITVNAQGQITAASSTAVVNTFSGGVTGLTPATATSGAVVLDGVLNPAYGGTGVAGGLTGYIYGNGAAAATASTTIPTSNLSGTVSNAQLANSSITLGTSTVSLGGTLLAPAGLTSVTVTADPTTAYQLATKQYVDSLASTGLYYHAPVQVATTQSLAAQTGGTVTYNNGASGVGATITLSVALTTLDGYSLSNTNRILVKDEVNQAYNGVYTWATGGTVLTRSTDTDSYGTGTGDLSENDYFFVQNGTVNKGSSYVVTTTGTIVFGTTAITFAQFSTSQVYTGTSPINVSGTVISLNTVPATIGGTGQTSYTTGDLLYASDATTLSKLGIGTTGYVLKSTGTGPQWQLNPTYFSVFLHSGATTNIPLTNGYFPVLLHNGVTTVNITAY